MSSSTTNSSDESLEILIAERREKIAKRAAAKKGIATHGKESKCTKKWIEVPPEHIDSYEIAQVKKCKYCHNRKSVSYAIACIVHDTDGDYTCFKCGESCNVKYMCPQCSGSLNRQLQRNNRDARLY